jgi:hypothetical protein
MSVEISDEQQSQRTRSRRFLVESHLLLAQANRGEKLRLKTVTLNGAKHFMRAGEDQRALSQPADEGRTGRGMESVMPIADGLLD